MKEKVKSNENEDFSFAVRCRISKENCEISSVPVFIKGLPVLRISGIDVPLCKHHFIFKCPRFISNTK